MESHVNVAKTLSGLLQANPQNVDSDSRHSSELGGAVQKFEAYFIQSMLKSMRSASLSSGLLDSDKSDFYRDWHDQQLASDLASKETFAVAKLLRRQFIGESDGQTPNTDLSTDSLFRRSTYASIGASGTPGEATHVASIGTSASNTIDPIKTTLKQLVTKEITKTTGISSKSELSTPEQFVQQLYPHAQEAALETGWGLHTAKAKYGQDTFNYFGIKANNWQGPEVTNVTKEFDGEKMIVIQDDFRAYETPADSFNDFAEFLQTNPRYEDALNNSSDAKAFVAALQKAGYATDPNYAKKINSILDGSILRNAINSLNELEPTADVVSKYETNNTH